MSPTAKLLLVAGVGREMYKKWRVQQMLASAVTVLMLTVAAAVMMSALAIGGIYAAYLFLLSQGMGAASSRLAISLIALFFTIIIVGEIRQRLCKFKSSMGTPLKEAADAFFDGLFGE